MNYSTLIIFALFFTAIGFIAALLIARLRAPDQSSLSQIRQERSVDEPDWQIPAPSPRSGSLQVWKDPLSGVLFIEMDGQVFTSVSQLSREQRRELSATTGELVNWLSQAVAAPPLPGAQPASISPPPAMPSALKQEPLPGGTPNRSLLSRALQPILPKEPAKQDTLAAQVDEILRVKLASSALAGRNIRLVDLPNHGLAVKVDQAQYDSIDEVPDQSVRELIQEAVAEWQRQAREGF